MNIINIGTPILTNQVSKVTDSPFFSELTFLDAEMIFWDVESSHSVFPGTHTKQNKLEKEKIETLREYLKNRKEEFNEFFKIGRSLIITSPIFNEYVYIDPATNNSFSLDFIECLNIKKPKISKVRGHNIDSASEKYINDFLQKEKRFLHYDVKIEKPNGTPLLFIKDTKYVISEYFKVDNGFVIILPKLKPELRDINNSRNFLNSLLLLISEVKKNSKPIINAIPDWVDEYSLIGEVEEKEHLIKLTERRIKLDSQIDNCKEKLSNFKYLKGLFSSDGTTLENIVEFIFKEIGFETIKPEGNKDDLIIKNNNNIAVLEIKGLSKSAAEKNSAQLQKWVSNYHVENDYNPKGILVVNTYKNEKLVTRQNKQDFPDQMLPYARQMGHCLVTGIQLLCIYLDFKSKKLKSNEVMELLFKTKGVLTYKENYIDLVKDN